MAKHPFGARNRARPRRPFFDIPDDDDDYEIVLGADEKEGLRATPRGLMRSR